MGCIKRLEQFIAQLPRAQQAAFEFRDSSWFQPETFAALSQILNASNCTLVIAIGGSCPIPLDAPCIGSFRYLRFHHGAHGIGLSDDELAFWAKRLGIDAAEGREVYVYFNNDAEGYAIHDALRLQELLGNAARINV